MALTKATGLAIAMLAATMSVHAGEIRLQAGQEQALDQVEALFSENQISITKQASTNRFALLYGQHADGTVVTVTLRELPQQAGFVDLIIATDSPHNPCLEQKLLRALRVMLSDNPSD